MYAALKGVTMPQGPYTIAEGIAVKSPGDITREVAGRLVDRIELVSESDIEHAIVVLLEIEKSVVEGAAGLAALLRAQEEGSDRYRGKRIGLVLTGGNIDPLMLGELIERGMVRAGRLARIRVDLRDLPGALAHATKLIADAQANITEVHHQRAFTSLPVRNVEVDFVLQTGATTHPGSDRGAQQRGLRRQQPRPLSGGARLLVAEGVTRGHAIGLAGRDGGRVW